MNDIKKIYKKHKQWVEIVQSFGCNIEISEDIVQTMYIKIIKMFEKNDLDISYDDDINYYYVYKTLKSLFIDLKRKQNKVQIIRLDDLNKKKYAKNLTIEEDINYLSSYNKVLKQLDDSFWYDRKVYEIIESGVSISELSRKTTISYYSLYNTYNKIKKKLKKNYEV